MWKPEGKGHETKNEGYKGYGEGRGKEEEHKRGTGDGYGETTLDTHGKCHNDTVSYT